MSSKNKINNPQSKIDVVDIVVILIILAIPLLFSLVYTEALLNNPGIEEKEVLLNVFKTFGDKPIPEKFSLELLIASKDILPKTLGIALFVIAIYFVSRKRKTEFKGIEHGSARWADKYEFKKFQNKEGIVLSDELSIDPYKNDLPNLNELIIGISGIGKSFNKIKPEVMNLIGSYVITDPKGDLYRDLNYLLQQEGYKVRVLNLLKPRYSNGYNPLKYIKPEFWETDILKLTDVFMKNTDDSGKNGGDKFWDDAAKALLNAVTYYVYTELEDDEKNYETIFNLIIKH